MKHQNLNLATFATALILAACSGGGSDAPAETTTDGTTTATPTTSTPTPSEPTTTTPEACTAAPINLTEPYSLVFKGCDANNVAMYYDKTECVRQNSTSLIWQGQMPASSGHLRANDRFLTNYDSTTALQKYEIATNTFVAPSDFDLFNEYNAIGFKNAVNGDSLCDSRAWRLPTVDELLGIIKSTETPKIDNVWFPNTPTQPRWYIASTPHAVADQQLTVSYFGAVAGSSLSNRSTSYRQIVRLVH